MSTRLFKENQQGFGNVKVLIAIALGLMAVGGGTYFIIQQKSALQKINSEVKSDTGFVMNEFHSEKCPFITYPMAIGTSDATTDGQVSKLQDFLREQNVFTKASTGYFDRDTTDAVTKWQKYVGFAGQLKTSGTVDPKTQEYINNLCVVDQDAVLKLRNVFITPKGIPTIMAPEGWTANVLKDEAPFIIPGTTLKSSGVRVLVTFADANSPHYRSLTYAIYSNPYEPKPSFLEDTLIESLVGKTSPQTKLISRTVANRIDFKVTELIYEGPDDITDADSYMKTRIFTLPFYTVVLTGASAKKFTKLGEINIWYDHVFNTINIPSRDNDPREIPIKTVFVKGYIDKLLESALAGMRVQPKGIESDFVLSKCYPFTSELILGSTDTNTGGEVSHLQEMLIEKYKADLGVSAPVTGVFDEYTELLTVRFQREMGLEGAGGVGAKTRAALNRCKIIN